jgi:hypothetical protein
MSVQNCDPPNYCTEDGVVEVEEVYERTNKGEEQGEMYQGRQSFNHPGNVKLIDAVGKECTGARSAVGTAL